MVRIDKFTYGEVRYCDCLDEEYGLPSLEDKSFDLCLTDPPFDVNYKTQKRHNNKNWKSSDSILYNDQLTDTFKEHWFRTCLHKTVSLIFTSGEKGIMFYGKIQEPSGYLYNHKPNGQGFTTIARMNRTEIILCFNIKGQPFKKNTLSTYIHNGFLRDKGTFAHYIHPHPKPLKLWEWIIKSMNPISVIDPFLGSGTTAEVCEKLGIKWLGYEINEVYKQDIDKRLKNVKREPQQISLEGF